MSTAFVTNRYDNQGRYRSAIAVDIRMPIISDIRRLTTAMESELMNEPPNEYELENMAVQITTLLNDNFGGL
jgi:hypothetical protein